MKAVETNKFPGYFHIPSYPNYAISKDGRVLNTKFVSELAGSRNPAGYYNYRITDFIGICRTWGRHRLLAYVFLHPGVDIADLVVNHKNGIKGDDFLDNLEWVTYQGNAEHAGLAQLTLKCQPIQVKDSVTNIVTSYPSFIECARDNGMTKDAIAYRVLTGPERIFPEKKQYRLLFDKREWYQSPDIERDLLKNGTSKKVEVRNVISGEIQIFPTASSVGKHLNVSPAAITSWLNRKDQPVLPGFVQMKLCSEGTPWRDVVNPYLELEAFTGYRIIRVKDAATSEEKIFTSAVLCARAMDINPTTLTYRLKSNGKTTFSDGFRYSYYNNSVEVFNGPLNERLLSGTSLN